MLFKNSTPPSELPSFRMKDHGLNQVCRQCQELSWHMQGVELLSLHNMEHISLRPRINTTKKTNILRTSGVD